MKYELLNIPFSPIYIATTVLILTAVFCLAWFLDSKTHAALKATDINDKEFQTHRLILIPSIFMEISLVLMYWFPWHALPFFLGFYLVRTVHEFIDELQFHSKRCKPFESYLHLCMWCSVHIKTVLLFIWGFFFQYAGVLELPIFYYVSFTFLHIMLSFITLKEFRR